MSSTGNRSNEIVAPAPSEPATTAWRNAYDASTWVELTGLPRVSSQTTVMSVNVNTSEKSRAMYRIGAMIGTMIFRQRVRNRAPSRLAASMISCGTALMPAVRTIAGNGRVRQTFTRMMDAIPNRSSPSQVWPRWQGPHVVPTQLRRLYVGVDDQ